MAQLVLGVGTSHSPLLALASDQWVHRAEVDRNNPALNLSDGRLLSYDELLAEVQGRYAPEVAPEVLASKAAICQQALDRLALELEQAEPDVVVIVGDDQAELFGPHNQPAIAIYHGAQLTTLEGKYARPDAPAWMRQVGQGYLMEKSHQAAADADLGLHLIQGMIREHIDVASVAHVPDPRQAGFGHAYGFVIQRLMPRRRVPVVPIMLNTYFPPNVPTSARAYDMGVALRKAIESAPGSARVAVVASGGLSHFVVDEAWDRRVLAALADHDTTVLRSVPPEALQSGSSETLNWIMVAGAVADMSLAWSEYQPLFRTPAGTGIGAAFCAWHPQAA